jgi:hypothetical protein
LKVTGPFPVLHAPNVKVSEPVPVASVVLQLTPEGGDNQTSRIEPAISLDSRARIPTAKANNRLAIRSPYLKPH